MDILILVLIFFAVASLTVAVVGLFMPRPFAGRLRQVVNTPAFTLEPQRAAWKAQMAHALTPASKLSLPSEGWENSPLRQHFMHAGLRGNTAPVVFFATKTILATVPPLVYILVAGVSAAPVAVNTTLFWMFLCAALGYYLPNVVLSRIIQYRQRDILNAFPDAIDLMTIMVEAGLGLDAAISRIGQEIASQSRVLAEEIQLMSLELRAGASREDALRNLARRTGVDEINLYVARLLQTDRFGTSMADSLRVHSESLRVRRRLKAEEAAAKVALKLLFPLTFCIFPSIMIVLLGPAVISIYRAFSTLVR